MQVNYKNLDRISRRGRVRNCLAFRAPLPAGYFDTYILVIQYIDRDGQPQEGVVRSQLGDVRCFRKLETIEKAIPRWGLPGIYVSVLEATSKENRLKYLSNVDWEYVCQSQEMPDYAHFQGISV